MKHKHPYSLPCSPKMFNWRKKMKNKKMWYILGLLVVVPLVLAACGEPAAEEPTELNALVWCDHLDPELLAPFEEEFNVTVNLKEYSMTGTALALIEQSQPGDWDVFVVDSVDVPSVVEAGVVAPLLADVFRWDDLFPDLREQDLH